MFKVLVLVLLVLSSIFAVPAADASHAVCEPGYIEVKDPETGYTTCVFEEKVVEEAPTILPFEFADFQEHIEVEVDMMRNTSEISVSMLSPNWQDILIPPKLESAIFNSERLRAIILTNAWQCVPGVLTDTCILVQIEREGLGEFTETIQKNVRPIADQIIMDSQFIGIGAKFHSTIIESEKQSEGRPALATVVYTTQQPLQTPKLISLVGNQLLDKGIRDAGGFYDVLNNFTENEFTEFTLTLKPNKDKILRTITVSLTTSSLPDEMLTETINPLNLIAASIPNFPQDKIYRSKYFSEGFFPLNSIFNVVVITGPDYKVKNVNGGLIATITTSADLEDSGWFFTSNSNGKIEGRYLFGTDVSASNQDLIFSITNNKAEYLGVQLERPTEVTESESPESPGGGCLIATAAFGSEIAPQVQLLREIRDNTVLQTESGTIFMTGFNHFYYSFSPAIADYERENPAFKETVKLALTPLLSSLTLLQFIDINSESEMLGYGIGIILLNIGMYLVVPAAVTLKLVKKYRKINF